MFPVSSDFDARWTGQVWKSASSTLGLEGSDLVGQLI
jgi:hypothetical protein